ncbi:MAG: hypothetical protein ACK5OX_15580 [Desertimonas sp.]
MHVEIEFAGASPWVGTISAGRATPSLPFAGRLELFRALEALVEPVAVTRSADGINTRTGRQIHH